MQIVSIEHGNKIRMNWIKYVGPTVRPNKIHIQILLCWDIIVGFMEMQIKIDIFP